MTNTENTKSVTLADLTTRLGLPDHEQSAVAAWTGDPYGTTWTEDEAEMFLEAWQVDQGRIARGEG